MNTKSRKKQMRPPQFKRFMNTIKDQLNGKRIELIIHRPDFFIVLHGGTQTKGNVTKGGTVMVLVAVDAGLLSPYN